MLVLLKVLKTKWTDVQASTAVNALKLVIYHRCSRKFHFCDEKISLMEYVLHDEYFKHILHNEHNGCRRINILHIMLQMADKHVGLHIRHPVTALHF